MPDRQTRCQTKKKWSGFLTDQIFWSGPDRYLPTSDAKHNPTVARWYNSDRLFRFERERAKLTDTIKLLEHGLSETQAEVVTLKTSNEEMTNKIADVCGDENLGDIKKTLAGNFISVPDAL